MTIVTISRYAVCISAAASLLAGCGGVRQAQDDTEPPIGAPVAVQQASALARTGGVARLSGSAWTFRVLHRFGLGPKHNQGPAYPFGGTKVNGVLYGTTSSGGGGTCWQYRLSGCGTIFRVSSTGAYKTLYSFPNAGDGEYPAPGMTDLNGATYGTTEQGGNFGYGTVFRVSPGDQETTLYSFRGGSDGADPSVGNLVYVDGKLYGTTSTGGNCDSGCGTVYKITTSGSENVLHKFPSRPGDGRQPNSGLTVVNGVMYGTTFEGAFGTIYSITTSGKEKVIYAFLGGAGGQYPHGVINVNGTLYGTTYSGGTSGDGVAYSLSTSGNVKVLYSFAGGTDGIGPVGDLVEYGGVLYGATASGGGIGCGGAGCGTIFSLTTSGTEKVLYSFAGGNDGSSPNSTLISMNGVLYGATQRGGHQECKGGCGVAFSLAP